MKKPYGYSLLELLLVIFIIGILSVFSIPSIHYFFKKTDAEILRSQLLSAIYFAKQEAKVYGLPVSLCPSQNQIDCKGEWIDGQLIFIDENQTGVPVNQKDVLIVRQQLHHKGKLYWRSFSRRSFLLFLPDETSYINNGTFWYCQIDDQVPVWAVILNRMQRERTVFPDKKGVIKDSNGKHLKC